MTFDEKLNELIALLGCTAKELADAAGLSPSVISRYRTGSRTPEAEQLEALTDGILRLAGERGLTHLDRETVAGGFSAALEESAFPYQVFQTNLDTLLTTLSVNVADFAQRLNYDASYISRIRNGHRRPSDPNGFATETARFVVHRYTGSAERATLARLMGCDAGELGSDSACVDRLVSWLTSGGSAQKDLILPFLTKVDEFDLNEFIRSIRFDELKVPSLPFQIPTSKNYYGFLEMRQGTLDFCKAAILSRSKEPLIMMDDTPMADKAEGTDFKKKFIFAVALALKKGLHIHFIHNINRPFEEMMMGLEGWIPMYMTGQISPYYLKGVHNTVFGHLLYTSGTAALAGECIMGFHEHGKFYLTNNKTEAAYYRRRSEDLLSKASPLMEIYRADAEYRYHAFLQTDAATPGPRRNILSSLPLYTLSEELLGQILGRSSLSPADREKVRAHAARQRLRAEELLARDPIMDELPLVSQAEFAEHPLFLPLSDLFFETDVPYTYQEYLAHRQQTVDYAAAHSGYTVRWSATHAFRNIQISIREGKWAVISKNKAPAIHFVIRHPKLLSAIESFVAPSER